MIPSVIQYINNMKAENKIPRIALFVIGCIIYWIFFATPWSDEYWYLDEIDFYFSFVGELIHTILRSTFLYDKVSYIYYSITFSILNLVIHLGYAYCLWVYREDIVVFIRNFIKKI